MKISADTIARTIVLALALVNQILAICGKGAIPITENDIYQVVTVIFTLVTAIIAWWKNNSFTKAAIQADEVMHQLKNEAKEAE